MRNSLKKLMQTTWGDRRPTAMDCAMLLLMALLACLTIITIIGQRTAIGYGP
jgi:cell division protein FtsB